MILKNISLDNVKDFASTAWHWWTDELQNVFGKLHLSNVYKEVVVNVRSDGELLYDCDGELPNKLSVILKLSPELFMYKETTMPLSARSNVLNVIQYEFDKYFPIQINESIYSYDTRPGSNVDQERVQIWVIHKDRYYELIEKVKNEFPDKKIKLTFTDDESRTIFNEHRKLVKNRGGKNSNKRYLYVTVCSVLTGMVVFYPAYKLRAYNEVMEEKIKQISSSSNKAIETRGKILEIEERLVGIINYKQKYHSTSKLLSHLSGIIKDSGTINRVSFSQEEIKLTGSVRSVEKIVNKLESSGMFTEIKITSPVTKSTVPGHELMNLSFKVKLNG